MISEIDARYNEILNMVKGVNVITVNIAYSSFLFETLKDRDKAIKILKKSINKRGVDESKLLEIKMKLADYYVLYGDFNKAMFYYLQVKESTKIENLKNEAIFKQARLALFKKDFSWAKSSFEAIKRTPSSWESNDSLYYYLFLLDCYEKESDDHNNLNLYSEAIYNIHIKDNEKALSILEELVKKSRGLPMEVYAVYRQAECFMKLENWNKALANYMYLLETYPDNYMSDKSCFEIAEIYRYKLNDYEKSKEYYKKILMDHQESIYLEDARYKYRFTSNNG